MLSPDALHGDIELIGRKPPMDGDSAAFILDDDAVQGPKLLADQRDGAPERRMGIGVANLELVARPVLEAVQAGHVEFHRPQQRIECGDAPPAHQRKRAVQLVP